MAIAAGHPRAPTLAPELRSWLLDSPALSAVSSLVLDAASCGLIDLEHSLATAVAFEARLQTLGCPTPRAGNRASTYRRLTRRPPPPQVRINGGVALLAGAVAGSGAEISQTARQATLHLATGIPETLITALPGRLLADLVSSPFLDARVHLITAAANTPYGADVTFDVTVVPITRIRPAFSRGFAARSFRDPARSR